MSDKETTFSVRLPDRLIGEVKQRILDLGGQPKGFSQTSVVRNLLEEWLGGKRTIEIVPSSSAPKGVQDDLERLRAILEHGLPSERDPLRGLIKTLSDGIEARSAQNPSRHRSAPKPKKKAG